MAPHTIEKKEKKRVVAVIQARMGSQRLAGKSLLLLANIPLIQLVIARVKQAKTLDAIILATSVNKENDPLCTVAECQDISWFRGSENDVLSRFIEVGKMQDADIIVRICADNPLIDPDEIDRAVRWHIQSGADYTFNNIPSSTNYYPDGFGAEVVSAHVLYNLENCKLSSADREHVTQYIIDHPTEYHIEQFVAPPEIMGPDIKLDIDTPEDYAKMKAFIENLPSNPNHSWTGPEIVGAYRHFFQTKIVIIFERPEHVIQCPEAYLSDDEQITRIATSPGTCWELEKRNCRFKSVEDYYDHLDLYHDGLKSYKIVDNICSSIDQKLSNTTPDINRYQLQPAASNYLFYKILYDGLKIRHQVLSTIIKRENPTLLIGFYQENPSHQSKFMKNLLPFSDNESLYGFIIFRQECPCHKMIFYQSIDKKTEIGREIRRPSLWTHFPNILSLNLVQTIGYYSKTFGIFETLGFLPWALASAIIRKKQMILLNYGYNWYYLIPFFYRSGIYLQVISNESLKEKAFGTQNHNLKVEKKTYMESDPLLREIQKRITTELFTIYCNCDNTDFSKLFHERVIANLYYSLRGSQEIIHCVNSLIRKNRIQAILCGPKTSYSEQIVAQVSRLNGVPVICYQHGNFGFHRAPIMFYQERMNTDLHLVWGPGAQRCNDIDPLNHWKSCATIPVGSYEIKKQQLRKKKDNTHNRRILYITTNYYGNSVYVSHPFTPTDIRLWTIQKKILTMLGNLNADAVLKLHPSMKEISHIYDFCENNHFRMIQIYPSRNNVRLQKNLQDFIDESDIIIIDWPTTSLIQALATKKIVFVLLSQIQISTESLNLLRKRAFCSDSVNEHNVNDSDAMDRIIDHFIEMVADYIEDRPIAQSPDVNNTEFLEEYGISDKNQDVATNVMRILQNPLQYIEEEI